jgi:hypothetical protein
MDTWIVGRVARPIGRATRLILRHPGDAALSARMACWVVLVSGLARFLSLPQAHRIMSTRVRVLPGGISADAPARLGRAIDRVLRLDLFMFRPSCWRRALVLQRFLALDGVESRVNFGVKTKDGELLGHAWLERDGQPLLESDQAAYVVTFSLPRRPATWESCPRG